MSKPTLVLAATAVATLGLIGCAAPEPDLASPPNVLLISLDALRAGSASPTTSPSPHRPASVVYMVVVDSDELPHLEPS